MGKHTRKQKTPIWALANFGPEEAVITMTERYTQTG